ncbi:MAG: LD-carboxypeptidase [Lachnospiraceae bacterium]|nr:LD-carboxypeptidase [Lachnospiraceae bacterium]
MRYPEFLQPGQTIGYVAPSYGTAIEPYRTAFLNALDKFEKLGFGKDLGPNVYKNEGIGISSTPEDCGRELTEYYVSARNHALISVGGGELMCEDLPYVDFERIRAARPKWYMGYSDNTNFTFLSTTLCDTAALYAPCAASFGMEPWHPAVQDAFDLLTGRKTFVESYDLWEKESLKDPENPFAPYNVTEPNLMRFADWDGTPLQGRLLGGCLDCLINLCGTRFDRVREFTERYKNDGILWFLEACDLNVFSIRRALWELREAGWFTTARGFLIGRPLVMGQEFLGLDQYEAVLGILEDFNVPILMDLDIGHLPPMMPLVSGSLALVSRTDAGKLRIAFDFS